MKLGAVYPQIELGGDPEAFHRIGLAVEAMGLDHLLMYDHVVGAEHEKREPPLTGPYTDKDPFHDPMVAFAYLAGLTKRIELVTGVIILPQRQTVLLAKQAADVDLLSGGRLRLGVGTGWNYVEYDALGQDYAVRGRRLSEQIPYIRRLWEEPLVTFKGAFDQIERGNILPRPRRRIPIYCGGFSDAAYRRAAKLADGFIFAFGFAEAALEAWQKVQGFLREEGRSSAGFGAHFMMQTSRRESFDAKRLAETLLRLRDGGATDASIVTMGRGFTSADQHIDFLAEAKQAVEAALR